MALRYYANAPATSLASSCSNSQTSLVVNAVTGFPIQYPYTLIIDRGTATEEAVSVTNASGTTLTVTRAIDSTTAFAHSIGAVVEHGVTAQDIREPNSHINASTAVHGIAGAVVGTTDAQVVTNKDLTSGNTFPTSLATISTAQTLTNKTIALGSNTVSGTTAQFNTALTDNDFATLAGAETLTNKTLTSPKVGTAITDTNGNEEIILTATASAVNEITLANAATGNSPAITASGGDANVGIKINGKGTGAVKLGDTAGQVIIGSAGTDLVGAWASYTPVLTSTGTNPTLGTGSGQVGRYIQIGKTVIVEGQIGFGTSGNNQGTGTYRVSIPVTANTSNVSRVGILTGYNPATGEVAGPFYVVLVDSTHVASEYSTAWPKGGPVGVGAGNPWAWGAQGSLYFVLIYEAA